MGMLTEAMKTRRSVRTFDGNQISAEDLTKLKEYAKTIENPYGIPVEFVWLDAKEHGLSSPVLAGEKYYLTFKSGKIPHAEEALGYSFEKLTLYAASMGIGTVCIAGTMKRDLFEKASNVQAGERMPVITPLGYPAQKMSLREGLMRKTGADKRQDSAELFYDGVWGKSLEGTVNARDKESGEKAAGTVAGDAAGSEESLRATQQASIQALENLRWAPSAVNKQPWRVVRVVITYHFYEVTDKFYVGESTGDLKKIDLGIGLAHFLITLDEAGVAYTFDAAADPGLDHPEGTVYIASVTVG